MDVERLRSVARDLINEDASLSIGAKLSGVVGSLNNLVSNPGHADFQRQVSESVRELSNALSQTRYERDPTFRPYVNELGGALFFSEALTRALSSAIQDNPSTPAVAQARMAEISGQRETFLARLRQLNTTMSELEIGTEELEAGDAQIGFRLPRELFNNELEGWIDELRDIKRIIRAFSELTVGAAERIEIGEISTTDPLIFLGVAAPTIAALGAAVSWCLDQWKKVEDIRKLRAETAKINETSGGALSDMVEQLDARVVAIIDAAIEKHSRELVKPPEEAGRPHEQVNEIAYALRGLLGRVERGMTIELKFLPPPAPADAAEAQAFDDIKEVVPTLAFPPPSPAPIIALPGPADRRPPPQPEA